MAALSSAGADLSELGLPECSIYFTDVRIGPSACAPAIHADQWDWSVGFYPGMEPGTGRRAIAATFEAAREAFEAAWSELRLTVPEAAFAEWRRDRDWRAAMAAKRARGEKRDSEIRSRLEKAGQDLRVL
ncbi:hypothetical protein BSZ19_01635 [Bradyrhizobium japonicum]|uniref:Uncharacterized protein n=1 Tax=Bradyrhizobium japonicum TaxID=375 RepID=A0A1Y2K0D0_BRAJP|nr:hypothetical protein BSZ19_01635 [Bradyrhizobium japonicum]